MTIQANIQSISNLNPVNLPIRNYQKQQKTPNEIDRSTFRMVI